MKKLVPYSCLTFFLLLCLIGNSSKARPIKAYSVKKFVCQPRVPEWKKRLGDKRCKRKCATDSDCSKRHQRCICDAECGLSCISRHARCSGLTDLPDGEGKYPSEYIVGAVATFGCYEGFTLIGSAVRRCQGNKLWSGEQPVCRLNVKCGLPPEVLNAHAVIPDHQNEFDLDELVNYTCNNGYWRPNGGLPRAKCLRYNGTAKWFGPNFTCVALTCGNPGTIINGRQHGFVYQYMSSVKFTCNEGYELQGSPIRTCQADRTWNGEDPYCFPKQCSKPADPLHGTVSGLSLDYLAKITYTCNEGYRLAGQLSRSCEADGTWSGHDPICEKLLCNSLGYLEHGHFEGDGTHYGDTVTFYCDKGARLVGAMSAVCEKDGWSNDPPKCLAACFLPEIENGKVRKGHVTKLVSHDHQIEIICNDSHELEKPENPKCDNGKWSYHPKCVPIRCKDWPPRNIKNGYVMFIKTDHNESAKYVCKAGFRLEGSATIQCLFGKWEGTVPKCNEIVCDHPNDVNITLLDGVIKLEGSMGTYEYKRYIKGIGEFRNILFECNKGYVLKGPKRATCVNGTWEPRGVIHKCLQQRHTPMEDTEWENVPSHNSRLKRSVSFKDNQRNYTSYASGGELRKRTNPVTTTQISNFKKLTQNRRDPNAVERGRNDRAGENDRRLKTFKKSVAVMCPALVGDDKRRFANIRLNPDNLGRYVDGSRMMVQCSKGYELSNSENAHFVCINGTWTPPPPICEPKNCGLPNIPNAYFAAQGEILNFREIILHGNGATVYCLRGFELIGNDVLECNLGEWLKDAGICKPKLCPLPYIRHGYFLMDPQPVSVVHDTVLRFECDRNYFPNPVNETNLHIGEVYCNFGNIMPHNPECNEEEGDHVLPPESAMGCRRPSDVEKAWIYKETEIRQGISMGYLIDPYMALYPNNTVVHYKCLPSQTYHVQTSMDEASSVKCVNGDWVALLTSCADKDILPHGVMSNNSQITDMQINGLNVPCKKPNVSEQSVVINDSHKTSYGHGSRLLVQCKFDALQKWVLKCRRGRWKHESEVQCSNAVSQRLTAKSCLYNPIHFRHVYTFYKDRGEPLVFKEQLPDGSELLFRCSHVGLYQFMGSKKLTCQNGTWKGSLPHCRLLNVPWQEGNAPAILYRAKEGDLSLSSSGEIIARTSSTLEIDCVLPKDKAIARWDHTNSYRIYPQRWANATIHSWDGDLSDFLNDSITVEVYRLTIYMARPEDSGVFFCVAPSGKRHNVNIKVININCPNITLTDKRIKNDTSKGTSFGSMIHFLCPTGYTLAGNIRIYCLENGQWSNSVPRCNAITCPPFTSDLHPALSVNITSMQYSGVALFKCAAGYSLHGGAILQCTENGKWREPTPTCRVVSCLPPDIPPGGKFRPDKSNFTYGKVISFHCESGYMLSGKDFAVCTDAGQWSNTAPDCHRFCRFPGKPAHGHTITEPHEYYFVHDRLAFRCMQQYRLVGNTVTKCLPNGRWSNELPKCEKRAKRYRIKSDRDIS